MIVIFNDNSYSMCYSQYQHADFGNFLLECIACFTHLTVHSNYHGYKAKFGCTILKLISKMNDYQNINAY